MREMMKTNKQPNRKRTYLSLAVLVLLFFVMGLSGSPQVSADPLRQGQTTLVSHYPDGTPADGRWPSVSSDGRYVAFESFDNLTYDVTDANLDVFVKDMATGLITRIPAAPVGWHHMHPSISGDGTKVAYLSGPCCYGVRAYVYDRSSGKNTLIQQPANCPCIAASIAISRDGKWAALVTDDSESNDAIVVSDTSTGESKYLAGICANCIEDHDPPSISASGRFIVYQSWDAGNVFLYDRDVSGSGVFDQPGNTSNTLVGILPDGSAPWARLPSISDDGRKVAFAGGPIALGTAGQVFVRDVVAQTTALVSQNSFGVPGTSDPLILHADFGVTISGNGSHVAFQSLDPHLAPGDLNPQRDVFLRDLSVNTTKLVSYLPDGTQGIGDRYQPALSQDGRFAAFAASLSYDGGLYALSHRVYLRDLQAPCSIACLLP